MPQNALSVVAVVVVVAVAVVVVVAVAVAVAVAVVVVSYFNILCSVLAQSNSSSHAIAAMESKEQVLASS